MNKFANALNAEASVTCTENGQPALNTTGSAMLDLFASIGALREADETRVTRLFADAYGEDPLLATKCLFYARDIREGLGEREVFRTILKYAATHHPEAVRPNIPLIGFYGRWDDLYSLIGTPLEETMWRFMKKLLDQDLEAMEAGKPCSLLAKWLKTADASSKRTRELGILTANRMYLSVYEYKRKVRALRKYIDVTEVKMSQKRWDEINYPAVPSRAMTLYRNAFTRHDDERFGEYLEKVSEGKEKINAGTLYPYDLVGKYGVPHYSDDEEEDPVIEAQWKALPNYVKEGSNAIVVADVSGSMSGRPMESAVALALYFAERNKGAYHGLWMSFSDNSTIHKIKGETLLQKIASIDFDDWGCSTNLEAAFGRILDIAVKNHIPPEEMVKSIIVISDMEINVATSRVYSRGWSPTMSASNSWLFYDLMEKRYADFGYKIPNVVFWNVDSRNDVFHVDADRKGVVLCSGQSATTFRHVIDSVDMTPVEVMLSVLNGERYSAVVVE